MAVAWPRLLSLLLLEQGNQQAQLMTEHVSGTRYVARPPAYDPLLNAAVEENHQAPSINLPTRPDHSFAGAGAGAAATTAASTAFATWSLPASMQAAAV